MSRPLKNGPSRHSDASDLTAANADVTEAEIRVKLDEMTVEARRQLLGEV